MWLVSVRIRLGATLDIVKSPVNVPPASGNLFVIAALEDVIYPAQFVIALLLREIFADPSKETPAIVLAVASVVAVEAAIPRASISDFV